MSDAINEFSTLSFEEALSQLEAIVKRLESGEASLEQSIEDYARGTALKSHCQRKLEEARLKVEKLAQSGNGGLTTEPFEAT